jgi:MinD-like ATPase involved in chromosome partitioning or flagellar assembly
VTLPVITAIGDPRREADLVSALSSHKYDVHVVRRCVDVTDLLAAAAAGLARAVVVSAELQRLDRDVLTRLAVAGVAVVGLAAPGDSDAAQRLRLLGIRDVLPSDAPAGDVAAAIVSAVGAGQEARSHDFADPAAALPAPRVSDLDAVPDRDSDRPGTQIAVWGPAGAPGRSSLALGLAAELADLGARTLLVDADPYGGVIAQLLGLLDEAPGLAAACRLANNGTLDRPALQELVIDVGPHLHVLTGIARAERWPELRPAALESVLHMARTMFDVVVIDCGFCLEQDEELSFDVAAPRRNGATLTAVSTADTVVSVASADPVGLQRLVRAMADLADVVPGVTPLAVVNRVRPAVVGGGDAEEQITSALQRYAGLSDVRFIPLDVDAFDRAVAAGRTLAEVAPGSAARESIQSIAASLIGATAPSRRRFSVLRRR